ncbi:hypothetical protein [Comamonas thiooxydans]|uniref:hypothetical protein n=1 Tax=Comamonas thiooxydans TaxID=363952 RepID=UPI0015553088|nr:hypothetical protein [Comamonas thiooxydans]
MQSCPGAASTTATGLAGCHSSTHDAPHKENTPLQFLSVIRHNKVFLKSDTYQKQRVINFFAAAQQIKACIATNSLSQCTHAALQHTAGKDSGHVRADVSSGPIPLLDP